MIKAVDTGDRVADAEVETEASGRRIARTKMMIVFLPTATATQLAETLASISATITRSLEGTRSVVVRIPDPGSLAAYRTIVAGVEGKQFVDFVWPGEMSKPTALPDNYADDPPDPSELPYIGHHIAVGATAAWNVRRAVKERPNVLVVDFFGGGSPAASTVNRNDHGTFNATATPNPHGYHVLGILAGTHGQHLVTGMFPDKIELHAIDLTVGMDMPTEMLSIIDRLVRIPGKVVVNTSLGYTCDGSGGHCIDIAVARRRTALWVEYVRLFGLEQRALFVTAAGNIEQPPGAAVRDAATGWYVSSAGLLQGLTDPEQNPVLNLTNTLVVENGAHGSGVADTYYAYVDCLAPSSFVGGDVMGIGTQVWSYNDAAGAPVQMSGTSMATPQVAGLAAYLWAVDRNMTPQEIIRVIKATGVTVSPGGGGNCSDYNLPSLAILPFDALLALDAVTAPTVNNSPVRLALLDVNDDGAFDEVDLTALITKYYGGTAAGAELLEPPAEDYDRYDLNGDRYSGGRSNTPFDLNRAGSTRYGAPTYGTASATIDGVLFRFEEEYATDMDVLCFYGHSALYTGDPSARDKLLSVERCSEILVVNDVALHLGDNANDPPPHGTVFSGTADLSGHSGNEYASATLEVEFMGTTNPFGVSGIDLYPAAPDIEVNGSLVGVDTADLPDPSAIQTVDLSTASAPNCIFKVYDEPFTATYDVTSLLLPGAENTVKITSGYTPAAHCATATGGYDDFAIKTVRLLLH